MTTRRNILKLGAVTVLGTISGLTPALSQDWPSPLVVVLADIDLDKTSSLANRILDIFSTHGIPVVAALSVEWGASTSISATVLAFIESLTSRDRSLCEIGLQVASLRGLSSYASVRMASDLHSELQRCLRRAGTSGGLELISTLITEGMDFIHGTASPLRAAGFTSIIDIASDTISLNGDAPKYSLATNGVAHFAASVDGLSGLVSPSSEMTANMLRAEARDPIAMKVSLGALSMLEMDKAVAYVENLCSVIDKAVLAREVRHLTARVLFEQTYQGPLGFRVELNGRGGLGITDDVVDYVVSRGLSADDFIIQPAPTDNSAAAETLDTVAAASIETLQSAERSEKLHRVSSAERQGRTDVVVGLDQFGRLHIPGTTNCQTNDSNRKPEEFLDTVVGLQKAGSTNVAGVFGQSCRAGDGEKLLHVKPVPVTEYYRSVVGTIPVMEYIQHARVTAAASQNSRNVKAEVELEGYLEDAQTAWNYFSASAKRYGRLVPATTWINAAEREVANYPIITMWDVGSLLLAAISASRLELIKAEDLAAVSSAVVKFLKRAVYTVNKSNLPSVNWSITGKAGDKIGFDAADVGRLLIALKLLDEHTAGAFKLAGVVADWDLAATIKGGQLHDIYRAKWNSVHRQSYSIYARRGFDLWGFDTQEIFEDATPGTTMDRAVRFIEEAASMGPFATEPFLTDEIELGASEHSRLISDVLFSAQFKRFNDTGKLTAVSEGPIDRQPWFIYQGFELNGEQENWPLHASRGSKAKITSKFVKANRLQSSKASFLWAAARPHEYHNSLVQNVRAKARTPFGFASGVYEYSGLRTQTLDINTNAVILESIAYIKNGRRPLWLRDR